MENNEIIKTLSEVFRDVLDNEDIVLNSQTNAGDIEEWDSINHIQLVVAIEKKFKVKFTTREIQNWNNVGDIVDAIAKKL